MVFPQYRLKAEKLPVYGLMMQLYPARR